MKQVSSPRTVSAPSPSKRIRRFSPYVMGLTNLANELLANPGATRQYLHEIDAALNGGPDEALRKIVPLQARRRIGAFFTGDSLLSELKGHFVSNEVPGLVLDPACGTGNLLVLQSRTLPILKTIDETVGCWGSLLAGSDLHQEFVEAAKARIVLSMFQRKPEWPAAPHLRSSELFPKIRVNNGLDPGLYEDVTKIVLNPPFQKINPPRDSAWAKGKVSAAALFLEACIRHSKVGTKIVAILPDVLRSGSSYEKWRQIIGSKATVDRIQTFGQFDRHTDVSVFILSLTKVEDGANSIDCWWPAADDSTVADFFKVRVGPVVPYRDKELGPEYRYVQPKQLPKWTVVKDVYETRMFQGNVVQPPFVVINRNSRFEDKHRATATIIAGKGPVAVENHLLVLEPNDGKLATCRKLQETLRLQSTNDWLNARIRCRHLTTSAVKDIPFSNK